MSKKKRKAINISAASVKQLALKIAATIARYNAFLFFIVVAIVYGFVLLRINALSDVQPTQDQISAQTTTTPVPRIDTRVVEQLRSLEDNSQNVQTLFSEARKNPF